MDNNPDGPRGPRPPWVPYVFLAVAGLITVALHVYFRWQVVLGPSEERLKPAPAKPTSPWTWLFAVLFVAVILFFGGRDPNREAAGDPRNPSSWVCLAILGFVVGPVIWAYARAYLRYVDRAVTKANRRAETGDIDGAILDLEQAIHARGPSANRLNGLGMLLMRKEDWPGAITRFREASALAPGRFDLRNNWAVALLNNGQAAEAETILAQTAATQPREPIFSNNHANILVALGRLDEAEARIVEAEDALGREPYASREELRRPIQEAIDLTRTKLGEARGFKDKSSLKEL